MRFFQRSAAPAAIARCSIEACLDQALADLQAPIETLMQRLPQTAAQHLATPLVRRLAAFAWDLPASEAHHHSSAFGLLTHSLEVAAHALVAFHTSSLWWNKAPDPAQRHRAQDHWLVGAALAGLLHDMGKVFDVAVEVSPSAAHGAAACWNPLQEPLLTFLSRHQTGTDLPSPTLAWRPGRGMQHEAAGALAATLLLMRDDLVSLTPPVVRELWAFLGGAPDPANLFRQLISKPALQAAHTAADRQSVSADRQAIPPSQPDLAARAVAALTDCCRDGRLRVNQFPGHVFVLEDQTLVVAPEGFKPVREQLAQAGVALPGGVILYNDLAEAGCLLGAPGRNVARAVFQTSGKRPVSLSVLRFPHAMLWGAAPPPPFTGQVALELPDAKTHEADASATLAAAKE